MKSFLRMAMTMATVVAFTSMASAQDKAKAPAQPATPATPATPAKAPTPAPKADPKTATPAKPADPKAGAPAKPADPKAAETKPAAPAMPTPPAEIAAAMKTWGGNWRCKGTMMGEGGTTSPMNATIRSKVDLDKFWIRTNLTETGKKKGAFKFESFTTFDGKKWHRVMVDNMGAYEVATAVAPAEGKLTWEGTMTSAMGAAKVRHHEELAGKENKMWGEWSMDNGKTWMKGYEVTCTR